MSIAKILVYFFFISFCCACGLSAKEQNEIREQEKLELIKKSISERLFNEIGGASSIKNDKLNSKVFELYSDSSLFWNDGKILNETALELISLTRNAINYGLDSSMYPTTKLNELYHSSITDTSNIEILTQAEFLFSKTALEYFIHIKYGILNHDDKDSLYYQLKIDSLKVQEITQIKNGLANNELGKTIEIFEPSFIGYKQLQKSWSKYISDQQFDFNKITVRSLKEDSAKSYSRARKALLLHQYIDSNEAKIDSIWLDKLKDFQSNHGLKRDGRIGRETAYALSRSNGDRRLSIMASIEKYKWERLDADTILYVNIPSYTLKVIEENKVTDEYVVVVGRNMNRTPTFSADMQYLILNPFWHIPRSISSKEILPKLQKDNSLAKKKGYRIYDKNRNIVDASTVDWNNVSESSFNYKISQTKSGGTALGKVKFIFTNKYSIYFHDTPSKRLFKNDIRAYSHGCVRIQNPLKLAGYLLSRQDPSMTLDSVTNFVKTRKQKRHNLASPVRVSIRYFTCEGNAEGTVMFYKDIYKKETKLKSVFKTLLSENTDKTS